MTVRWRLARRRAGAALSFVALTSSAMARSILRRWPSSTPSLSKSSPNSEDHNSIPLLGKTLGVLANAEIFSNHSEFCRICSTACVVDGRTGHGEENLAQYPGDGTP